MIRQAWQVRGWVVVGGLALAVVAALMAPVWLRMALNLLCLGGAVWWATSGSGEQARQGALLRDLVGQLARVRANEADLEAAAGRLVEVLKHRPALTTIAQDCTELCRQTQSSAAGLLEDAALVREDLSEIAASLARVLVTEGAAVEKRARGIASLVRSSEAKAATFTKVLTGFLSEFERHEEQVAASQAELQTAAKSCLAELAVAHEAVTTFEGVLEAWRRPTDEVGQTVQIATDLAEQARILGVNASIEALRSGEAGRGFMLVAEEAERISERLLRMAHHVAAQIEESDQAGVRLGDQLAQVRLALDRGNEAGERLVVTTEALRALPSPCFPEDALSSVSRLLDDLAPDVRSLSDRLAGALCHIDTSVADEGRNAAARLFDSITALSAMLRSFVIKVDEFAEHIQAAEDTLAAASAAGRTLQGTLGKRGPS